MPGYSYINHIVRLLRVIYRYLVRPISKGTSYIGNGGGWQEVEDDQTEVNMFWASARNLRTN